MAKYRFKLLQGRHVENDVNNPMKDANGKILKDADGNTRYHERCYDALDPNNNIIETDINLAEKFNAGPQSMKFQLLTGKVLRRTKRTVDEVTEEAPEGQTVPDDSSDDNVVHDPLTEAESTEEQPAEEQEQEELDFSSMTNAQLKEYASQHGIDLEGAKGRMAIIGKIREAQSE